MAGDNGDFEQFVAGLSADRIAELREIYDAPPEFARNRLYMWLSADVPLSNVTVLLDTFQGQLLEAMLVLGPGRRRQRLDEVVDGRATKEQVDAARVNLTRQALAWSIGGGKWALNPGLPRVIGLPCGLGLSGAQLLPDANVAQLQKAARLFGVEPALRKAALVEQVTGLFADAERVRAVVPRLSPPAQSLLSRLVNPGGVLRLSWNALPPAGGQELIDRALIVVLDYDTGMVPAEVALAVRGGHILLTVTPEPPDVGEPVAGDATGRYAEAVATVVSDLARLLSNVSVRPLSQLASGGVGSKELRRLAKELALPESRVNLLLCLAEDVEALSADSTAVVEQPGSSFAALAPAGQWLAMTLAFLTATEAHAARVPFGASRRGPGLQLPPAMLLTLLPRGRKLSARDLDALLAWRLPKAGLVTPGEGALASLADAEVLGLAVDGVATSLVRLVMGDPEAALEAVAALLPAQVDEVILQADLTATTTGPPGPALARLMDGAAESETSGHASVWRFTPASVRRYLGEGGSGDELLAALASMAPRGVPSTLEQLVADAARRQGEVEVRSAAAVVVARDAAIAATLLGDRRLAKLRFTRVAPTVLLAAVGEDAVMDAVRKAGYAPAAVTGGPQIVGPDLQKLVKAAMRGTGRSAAITLLAAVRDGRPVSLSVWAGGDFFDARLESPRLDSTYVSGKTADGRTQRFKLSNIVVVGG